MSLEKVLIVVFVFINALCYLFPQSASSWVDDLHRHKRTTSNYAQTERDDPNTNQLTNLRQNIGAVITSLTCPISDMSNSVNGLILSPEPSKASIAPASSVYFVTRLTDVKDLNTSRDEAHSKKKLWRISLHGSLMTCDKNIIIGIYINNMELFNISVNLSDHTSLIHEEETCLNSGDTITLAIRNTSNLAVHLKTMSVHLD